MRIEPSGVGSIVHVVKRGARGMHITQDQSDQLRFLLLLRHLNDEFKSENWEREISLETPFARPDAWPEEKPLTQVLAWTLMPNHFHLILRETRERGVSKFMQKVCNSMTSHFNVKYAEKGSIFQGAYKSRTIASDAHLLYVAPYVMVKNTLELFPGGLREAQKDFERAWKWAVRYPYTSLSFYAGVSTSPIIRTDENIIMDIFPTPEILKKASREMLEAHIEKLDSATIESVLLEGW